jgi:hypothetical protein
LKVRSSVAKPSKKKAPAEIGASALLLRLDRGERLLALRHARLAALSHSFGNSAIGLGQNTISARCRCLGGIGLAGSISGTRKDNVEV